MVADLKLKLDNDLKQALKTGDKVRLSVLRLLSSAAHNVEIARQAELTDGDILGVIAKEAKQREESIAAYRQGNRADLVSQEEAELAILKAYLPEQMTHDEIITEARKVIAEVGAQGLKDKGKVMGKLVGELKGRADGREINEVVTQLLQP
ncbi:MAG: GatB/YqeY domain-containing protein [Chloroflexota bacterium]